MFVGFLVRSRAHALDNCRLSWVDDASVWLDSVVWSIVRLIIVIDGKMLCPVT